MAKKKSHIDPCGGCVYDPPSSTDGKPCCMCDPNNVYLNCYQSKHRDNVPKRFKGHRGERRKDEE